MSIKTGDIACARRRVLFVCVANTCRSPMAAALARERLRESARVESAGISAEDGAEATTDAIEAMSERGLDLTRHRSRPVSAVPLSEFDVVVAMTPRIGAWLLDKGVPDSRLHSLTVPDPLGRGLEAYRATAAAIEQELARIFGSPAAGD